MEYNYYMTVCRPKQLDDLFITLYLPVVPNDCTETYHVYQADAFSDGSTSQRKCQRIYIYYWPAGRGLPNRSQSASNLHGIADPTFQRSTCPNIFVISLCHAFTMAYSSSPIPRYSTVSSEEAEEQFYNLLEDYPEQAFPYFDHVATGEIEPCHWCEYCLEPPCRWDCLCCPTWRRESRLLLPTSNDVNQLRQPPPLPPLRDEDDRCTTTRSIDYSWEDVQPPSDSEDTVVYAWEVDSVNSQASTRPKLDSAGESIYSSDCSDED